MERIKNLKTQLLSAVEGQMANLACADYEELGAAIDMIKDLDEALYYCTITEAMEKKDKEQTPQQVYYYNEYYHTPRNGAPFYEDRDMDKYNDRMYYSEGGSSRSGGGSRSSSGMGGNKGGSMNYWEPNMMRDVREGHSPIHRKMYMEAKQTHQDSKMQMQELERYMTELSNDLTEMINDATPEEKQLL